MSHPKNKVASSSNDDRLLEPVVRAADGAAPAEPCPDAELLALYAGQALEADERPGVERHVSGCGRCQATLVALVRAEAAEAEATGTPAGAVASWWAGWRWMVPVAASAVVVAVAVWVGQGPSDQVAESARMAENAARPEPSAPLAAEAPPAAMEPAASASPAAPRARAVAGEPREVKARPRADAPSAGELADRTRPTEDANRTAADEFRQARQALERDTQSPPTLAGAQAAREKAAEQTAPARQEEVAGATASAVGGMSPASAAPEMSGSRDARAASAKSTAATNALTGTVTYRTREALPAGARIDVRLLDVSRADVAAVTLARTEVVTNGEQVPVAFTLRYPPDAIQPGRRYAVQASIAVDGRVRWQTSPAHPVFADGAAATTVVVVVEPVR